MAVVGFVLIANACASGRFGPSPSTRVPEGKRTLKNLSVNERDALLQRAKVWQPIDTRSLNLAEGPPLPAAQRIGKELTCRFVFPEKPLKGNTPKFRCELRPDDDVKVKYGEKNGEVYAEIAASRLFWALGFKADRMYPAASLARAAPLIRLPPARGIGTSGSQVMSANAFSIRPRSSAHFPGQPLKRRASRAGRGRSWTK
jgi:hypothetical protein